MPKTTNDTTSLFQNHLLQPESKKPEFHTTQYDYIPALIVFITFLLFVVLYTYNRKKVNNLFRAFYINRFANQLMREEVSMVNRTNTVLLSISFVVLSMFAFQLIKAFHISFPFSQNFLVWLVPLLLVCIYFLKIVLIKFLGGVFKTQTEANSYIFNVILFLNILGILSFPLVIGMEFMDTIPKNLFIYCGYAIISMLFITRLVKGVIIGINSSRVSGLYLFFYLCTLEILPVVILVKLFLIITN